MAISISIFGDSISYGQGDTEKGGWVNLLKSHFLENDFDINVHNSSFLGDRTEESLKRVDGECKIYNPAIIIFQFGINDSAPYHSDGRDKISENKFKENIESLYSKAIGYTNKIVFVCITSIKKNEVLNFSKSAILKCNRILEEFSKSKNVVCIKLNSKLFPKHFSDDGLHPNSRGHEIIF